MIEAQKNKLKLYEGSTTRLVSMYARIYVEAEDALNYLKEVRRNMKIELAQGSTIALESDISEALIDLYAARVNVEVEALTKAIATADRQRQAAKTNLTKLCSAGRVYFVDLTEDRVLRVIKRYSASDAHVSEVDPRDAQAELDAGRQVLDELKFKAELLRTVQNEEAVNAAESDDDVPEVPF